MKRHYEEYVHIPVAMFQARIIDTLKSESPDPESVIRFCEYCIREHSTEEYVPVDFDDFE